MGRSGRASPGRLGRASVEPGQEALPDVAAAARSLEPRLDAPVVDDQDRGHALDAEALGEVGSPVDRDAHEVEGVVVATALEHLGDVTLVISKGR